MLTCSKEYHHTQDEPADDSVEVCGTPYIVDTGSGVGEQVMDCVYEVYWDYCSYTDYALSVIDTVIENGYDLNPYWPEPSINAQQQIGDKKEKYVCVFDTENGQIEYQTSSYSEFSQCQIGSTWDLELSGSGQITNLSIRY